jgi:4-amino-4-deoxychorismate lyase
MILVNGTVGDSIHILDRGLQYGDGLFETIAVMDGHLEFWSLHLDRLQQGCKRLGISAPDPILLQEEAAMVCENVQRGVLKILITRGIGGRGYRPPQAAPPTRILSVHDWPPFRSANYEHGIRLRICATRLAPNPVLAGLKHLNRLEQVLARSEWDDPDIAEGVMLSTDEEVISGTMTNLFVVTNGTLRTPDLGRCGIEGVTRRRILELAVRADLAHVVCVMRIDDILKADEVFVCNSLMGIVPVRRLEQHEYGIGPLTRTIMGALMSKKQ